MAAKRVPSSRARSSSPFTSPGFSWKKFFLLISLLPMAAGALLIISWAIDLRVWEPQVQIDIAIFAFLLGFAISNTAQQKWMLASGWLLLAIGDLLFLSSQLNVLYIAITLSVAGILLVAYELIARVIRQRKNS